MAPTTTIVAEAPASAAAAPGLGAANPSTPAEAQHTKKSEADPSASLRVSAKWGYIMSTVNLVYGYVMVASHLSPDPRQDTWAMMRSPLPTFLMTLAYIWGVTRLGPQFMAGRSSVSGLRPIMMVYNAFQVLFSLWLFYMNGMGGWFGSYSLRCQACDFSNNPQALTMLHACYWYYFSKFVDFFDTVFFVLNKKYEHISVLHVVHHSLMPVSMWYGVRYQPGGNTTLLGFLNSIIHTVMYLYYLLAAMGPRVRPYLWWKKYLTTLQMLQFGAVMLHVIQLSFIKCPEVPARLSLWVFGNATMFLFLFYNFYKKSYIERRTKRQSMVGTGGISDIKNPLISFSAVTSSGPNGTARYRVGDGAEAKEMEVLQAAVTSDNMRSYL